MHHSDSRNLFGKQFEHASWTRQQDGGGSAAGKETRELASAYMFDRTGDGAIATSEFWHTAVFENNPYANPADAAPAVPGMAPFTSRYLFPY
jgi:hypothetical protein